MPKVRFFFINWYRERFDKMVAIWQQNEMVAKMVAT